jgi:hypothetical protein|tara:strand:- start:4713 stop:5165 length:453 start_codon:yes stop_codon:yes gene_type:complete
MNPVDIINWTRAPPEKVLLMRVSKSNPAKVPITKTRIRYLPMADQDIYENLMEMLRSMRVSTSYQQQFNDYLDKDEEEWFNTICRKSQEMNDGTVDFWLFWAAVQDEGFELFHSGKEAVDRINSLSKSYDFQKHCFLFHVKAVETKIKTQ